MHGWRCFSKEYGERYAWELSDKLAIKELRLSFRLKLSKRLNAGKRQRIRQLRGEENSESWSISGSHEGRPYDPVRGVFEMLRFVSKTWFASRTLVHGASLPSFCGHNRKHKWRVYIYIYIYIRQKRCVTRLVNP